MMVHRAGFINALIIIGSMADVAKRIRYDGNRITYDTIVSHPVYHSIDQFHILEFKQGDWQIHSEGCFTSLRYVSFPRWEHSVKDEGQTTWHDEPLDELATRVLRTQGFEVSLL
jgi:hypothetical protein